MTSMAFQLSSLHESDAAQFNALVCQCFVTPVDREARYLQRIGLDNMRVLHYGSQLVGGLATLPMGQWFGGKLVPMVGIAAVSVAPEWRGQGAALVLMQETLRELQDRHVPISTLYPAVQRLYRQVGYEQGGTRYRWHIDCDRIQVTDPPLPVSPMAVDIARLRSLQQQQAAYHNGHLDRAPVLWNNLLDMSKQALFLYQFGPTDQPQGYVAFHQGRQGDRTQIDVLDWVVTSPAALKTLWAFLGSHRSQIDQVQWRSGLIDPLALGLPNQEAKPGDGDRWMVRIVDVVRALECRGYPLNLTADLYLTVQDDLLSANTDTFRLSVANGQGQVTRQAGEGLSLSIQGLAALYTGLFSPTQLRWMRWLEGSDQAVAIATQMFATGSPWMPDFF